MRGDHEISDLSLDNFLKEDDWENYSMPTYTDEQIASVVDAAFSRIKIDVIPFIEKGVSEMLCKDIAANN